MYWKPIIDHAKVSDGWVSGFHLSNPTLAQYCLMLGRVKRYQHSHFNSTCTVEFDLTKHFNKHPSKRVLLDMKYCSYYFPIVQCIAEMI